MEKRESDHNGYKRLKFGKKSHLSDHSLPLGFREPPKLPLEVITQVPRNITVPRSLRQAQRPGLLNELVEVSG
jgi:hypothetical protein